MVAILRSAACTTTGLMAVCSRRTMSRANAWRGLQRPCMAPYLMTMVSRHTAAMCGSASDRMRLIERTDIWRVGHERVSGQQGGAVSI